MTIQSKEQSIKAVGARPQGKLLKDVQMYVCNIIF